MQILWENIPAFSVTSFWRNHGNPFHSHTIFALNLYTVLFLFFPQLPCRVQRKRKGTACVCAQIEQSIPAGGRGSVTPFQPLWIPSPQRPAENSPEGKLKLRSSSVMNCLLSQHLVGSVAGTGGNKAKPCQLCESGT